MGLRFPARPIRQTNTDWQIFRLERRREYQPKSGLEGKEFEEDLRNNYEVMAVMQEHFTENYFHMRNRGRADRSILKKFQVSLIGCGALGSEIADCLGKAGVGEMVFVDKEELKVHNIIRHSLGIKWVSYPKVLGMLEQVKSHNPFIDIDIKNLKAVDILSSDIEEYLPEKFFGISTIADDNVEAYLNEQAIEKNKTIFYCRALRGGKVARIFRVIPKKDACKLCLSLYKQEQDPSFIDIEEDEKLPIITNECNNPIRPASAADLKMIASLCARIVIDDLQGNNNMENHWIWTTEPLKNLKMKRPKKGLINSQFIPPHPDCPICQDFENKKVLVLKDAHEDMKQQCKDNKDIETGGVLIGYITEKGKYVVLMGTQPGPRATRSGTTFIRDENYCQEELVKASKELKDKGLYLGEWHYHPQGTNMPSGLDIKSLTEIARQENYLIVNPISIIFSPAFEGVITIHDKSGRCVQLPIEVIESIDMAE